MVKRKKPRRARRNFTPEFKAEAVRLCKVGERTVTQVAIDLDLTETALRDWVKRADIDAGEGPPGGTDERRAGGADAPAAREQAAAAGARNLKKLSGASRRRLLARNSSSRNVADSERSGRLLFGASSP
jgi:transposase-like protein